MIFWRRLKDPRLNAFPKVYRHRRSGNILIDCNLLTPIRVFILHYALLKPLAAVWTILIWVTLSDWAVEYFSSHTLFNYLPFDRSVVLAVMGLSFGLWLYDSFSHKKLSRALLGRNVRITITHDEVHVSGLLRTKKYPRAPRLAFLEISMPQSDSTIYQESDRLGIVLGDTRKVRICEIFDLQLLKGLVSNANVALTLSAQHSDVEVEKISNLAPKLHIWATLQNKLSGTLSELQPIALELLSGSKAILSALKKLVLLIPQKLMLLIFRKKN